MSPGISHDWGALIGACVPLLPALCLGLSGFELTLMAMPLVRGRKDDSPEKPRGVIRNTRILLVFAALTMSSYLLTSTLRNDRVDSAIGRRKLAARRSITRAGVSRATAGNSRQPTRD